MLSSANISIDDLIKTTNPFAIKFVDQSQVWGKGFFDVPEINSHVSDEIFDSIGKVIKGEIPSISIVIAGEKGFGKTQIISRVRHRLQAEGRTFFVYMGNYGHLDYIKSEFLQTLTSSLKRIGSEGVTQWQELAANMFYKAKGKRPCTPKELAGGIFASHVTKNPTVPSVWTKVICAQNPHLNNPYLVKAILWTLSEVHAPYATSWLAGQELTQMEADQLGLPKSLQNNESLATKTIYELLSLIGNYNNLVVCFDELDSTTSNTSGFTTAQVVADLAKDLRNSNTGKCVFLMAMYTSTLHHTFKHNGDQGWGGGAIYDRIADKVLELEHLDSDTSVLLVRRWLENFYASKEVTPPHPLYPFDESKIRQIGHERPLVRPLLKWCSENWKVTGPEIEIIPPPDRNPVQDAYQHALQIVEDSIEALMEDNSTVGVALYYAFLDLINKEVDGIKIIDVDLIDDYAKSANGGYLHFRITVDENGTLNKIGVGAILNPSGNFVGAALKRLIDYKKFGFTRGCLVRAHKISNSATVAQKYLKKLIKEQGGEWVVLLKEHIKPLIALVLVFNDRLDYELEPEQISTFISESRLVIDNPLIREILSDPSGQEPSYLIDDELPISIPQYDYDEDADSMEELTLS